MATKIPSYSYTGSHSAELIGETWYIYLLSSGTLTLDYTKKADIFLCGSGAGGSNTSGENGATGGGGGKRKTVSGETIAAGSYAITVGASVSSATAGKATSAFNYSAAGGSIGGGGSGGSNDAETAGGKASGGSYPFGASAGSSYAAKLFGTNGAGGGAKYTANGSGINVGGKTSGAGGGGTGYYGGGGGGAKGVDYGNDTNKGGASGAGIVILRETEDDFLPVWFNGTQLSEMYMNGAKVETFTFDGTKIF